MTDPDRTGAFDAHAVDREASVVMKRGLRLITDATPAAIAEALECFDQAIELRRDLPIDEVPQFRYGLAAAWLNRGDALARLGDPKSMSAALDAYNQGIGVAAALPLEDDPRYPRRLAIAHQNRGLILFAHGGPNVAAAVGAFTDAIAILDSDYSAAIDDRQHLRAVVWMNLANAHASLADLASAGRARDAARHAIDLVKDEEQTNPAAAEVALAARHVLCQAVARRLSSTETTDQPTADDIHEATDVADDGLSVARRWEQKGVTRFRGIAYDLFRFGARVYAIYQPQFLGEFIEDNMDPAGSSREYVDSPEMRGAAAEAIGYLRE